MCFIIALLVVFIEFVPRTVHMFIQKSREIFNGKSYVVNLCAVQNSKNVVVFLPGVSGGAFDARFDFLLNTASETNFSFLRCDFWKSGADLDEKSISELLLVLRDVISLLLSKGFTKIVFIGKSFGGLLALLLNDSRVSGMILISPTAFVADTATAPAVSSKKLGSIHSIFDVTVDKSLVWGIRSPVLVVHGNADAIVPVENSQKLVSFLRRGELFIVEGADHSFKTVDHQAIVVLRTKEFLSKFN